MATFERTFDPKTQKRSTAPYKVVRQIEGSKEWEWAYFENEDEARKVFAESNAPAELRTNGPATLTGSDVLAEKVIDRKAA